MPGSGPLLPSQMPAVMKGVLQGVQAIFYNPEAHGGRFCKEVSKRALQLGALLSGAHQLCSSGPCPQGHVSSGPC